MTMTAEARAVRRWILLSVGSLVLSGLLAALLVIGRLPALSRFISDPNLFRRFLVVHVDLSLVVWMYAFIAGLIFLLPRAGQSSKRSRVGVFVAAFGVLMLIVAGAAPGARPIIANYVPMIDHWSFGAGLIIFAAGVLASVCDRRLLPSTAGPGAFFEIPAAAVPGLRATGIALVLAALTFAFAWVARPQGLTPDVLYELTNWGGGHVLQLASSLAMASVWLILLNGALGRSPVSRPVAGMLFGWMLLPWAASPLLAARGVQDVAAREAFTELMRWGIFPPVLVFLVLCLRALVVARREGRLVLRDARVIGFFASAGLSVLGWVLGAAIRGSTTMIPAHYHAAIGAVTVAFMAVAYPLLESVDVPVRVSNRARRLAIVQPALFGIGQSIFAIGFGIAGSRGMSRKVYGQEQQVNDFAHALGLATMGLGGLLAIVSGVIFLSLVVAAVVRRERIERAAWALRDPTGLPEPGGTHG
jgi:cytochrome c oxidase subunit I